MGRGGKRPGAGAPVGNLNGFKHGRYSYQYQRLLEIIASSPEAIAALRDAAEYNNRRKAKLRRQAEKYLSDIIQRVEEIQSDLRAAQYELNQRIPPPGWLDPGENAEIL